MKSTNHTESLDHNPQPHLPSDPEDELTQEEEKKGEEEPIAEEDK